MSARKEERSREESAGAFESEEVSGGEAAISASKEYHAQDENDSSTDKEEDSTEVETMVQTREETSIEEGRSIEQADEEPSQSSCEDLPQNVCSGEVLIPPTNQDPQLESTSHSKTTGFLPWEEDIQMLSAFTDKKEELMSSHAEYMRLHPELRALLADFLQALLIQKPDNVFKFAHNFFRPYHPQASHTPPFPSTAHS